MPYGLANTLVNPQVSDTLCATLLGESSPPKAAKMWQLLFRNHTAAFMQRLAIPRNIWKPNHHLSHNCKPGLQFTAGLRAGLQVNMCKEHQNIFTRATHGGVPLSSFTFWTETPVQEQPTIHVHKWMLLWTKKQSWGKVITLTHKIVEAKS